MAVKYEYTGKLEQTILQSFYENNSKSIVSKHWKISFLINHEDTLIYKVCIYLAEQQFTHHICENVSDLYMPGYICEQYVCVNTK